jgi:RNA-binding protein
MATALTSKQRSYLKGLGHGSKPPLFQVGKEGLSDAVVASIDRALTDHELIKVQFLEKTDIDRKQYARTLEERCGAHLVQLVGFRALLYRPNPENPRIVLPA